MRTLQFVSCMQNNDSEMMKWDAEKKMGTSAWVFAEHCSAIQSMMQFFDMIDFHNSINCMCDFPQNPIYWKCEIHFTEFAFASIIGILHGLTLDVWPLFQLLRLCAKWMQLRFDSIWFEMTIDWSIQREFVSNMTLWIQVLFGKSISPIEVSYSYV